MITVTAHMRYDYQTEAEKDAVLAMIPADAKPVVDLLTKTITYTLVQRDVTV